MQAMLWVPGTAVNIPGPHLCPGGMCSSKTSFGSNAKGGETLCRFEGPEGRAEATSRWFL